MDVDIDTSERTRLLGEMIAIDRDQVTLDRRESTVQSQVLVWLRPVGSSQFTREKERFRSDRTAVSEADEADREEARYQQIRHGTQVNAAPRP